MILIESKKFFTYYIKLILTNYIKLIIYIKSLSLKSIIYKINSIKVEVDTL